MEKEVQDSIETAIEDILPSDEDFLIDLEYINDFGHEIEEWSR